MLITDDIKLDYSDVLIRPKRSTLTSRHDVDISRTYQFVHSKKTWTGTPIIAANMDTVGTPSMYKTLNTFGMITSPARHYLKHNASVFEGNNLCMMGGLEDVSSLVEHHNKWDFIGIDVANGYTISVIEAVKKLRAQCPNATIVVGNVVTADITQELILSGADIIKVGIGPGSVCTTRVKTGIGYPQLSAVMECADAAHGLNAHIIADGGCTSSGDIVKAFAGGADFVMIGGMLAGHDECDGEVVDGKMKFYGMASESAMSRHNVPTRDYRGVEGKTVEVKYKGAVHSTVIDILSGIRSACTYVGAETLKSLSRCTTFVRVNNTHNTVFGNE